MISAPIQGSGIPQPLLHCLFRMAQHYKDLVAWRKSVKLVSHIYSLTDSFPRRELFALTSQLRRAAVSIPSNIAEGQARFSHKEFVHFLRNARGSLAEVETQIVIARDLKYISGANAETICDEINEISRIVMALITAIQARADLET